MAVGCGMDLAKAFCVPRLIPLVAPMKTAVIEEWVLESEVLEARTSLMETMLFGDVVVEGIGSGEVIAGGLFGCWI